MPGCGRWLRSEAAVARRLAGATPVPVPVPVAVGEPGGRYPVPGSMQTWRTGVTASVEDPGDSEAFASGLASFILVVRAIGTEGRTFDRLPLAAPSGRQRSARVSASISSSNRAYLAGRSKFARWLDDSGWC